MTHTHPKAIPKRPIGQETRGKTARNRLRRVDTFLAMYDPGLLRRTDGDFARAFFVDLGYGAEAWTTLESAERLRRFNPQLPVMGVEIDPERVAAAQPFANELTHFRLGGFNLPLATWPEGRPERVRVVRAFNVLRQYEEASVFDAWSQMMRSVLSGGLLIEGTSDPYGRIWVANLIRQGDKEVRVQGDSAVANECAREEIVQNPKLVLSATNVSKIQNPEAWFVEALVFSTNFRTGFDPSEFQERLPKNLIHRVVVGEWIYDFFEAWKRATASTAAYKTFGLRHWFIAAGLALAEQGFAVETHGRWLAQGYLILRW